MTTIPTSSSRGFVLALIIGAIALRCLWVVFLYSPFVPGEAWPSSGEPAPMLRFEALVPFLPSGQVIGFIVDATRVAAEEKRDLLSAQYILAPVLLDDRHERDVAIASFASDGELDAWLTSGRYVLSQRVAFGLAVVKVAQP